jgi:hypothetical protein
MNTHTPGPWSIDSDPYPARFHNENPPRLEDVYEITNRDAGATPAYATSEADARLIAAAPELLKALDKIHSWLVTAAIASPQDMAQSFPEMERIASEALAKTKEA